MNWFRSRLLWYMIFALLTVSVIPLLIVGNYGLNSYENRTRQIIETNSELLNESSLDRMEATAANLAYQLAAFLREHESNLRYLATLPPDEATYASFMETQQGDFWTVDGFTGEELRLSLPFYREVAFIDLSGQEQIKIQSDCFPYPLDCEFVVAENLQDVSNPQNTTFGNEDYFTLAQNLAPDAVYVSRPIGHYVPVGNSFKGRQFLRGQRYEGVVRFVMRVWEDDEPIGYVMLALDHTHILNFVEHTDPTSSVPLAAVDPRADNIAYIIGSDGNAIAHVQHENIAGVDEDGQPVPPFTEENRFGGPGNFYQMGFLSPVFPQVMTQALNRPQGVISRFDLQTEGRQARSLAYSIIPYYNEVHYGDNRGFGLVIVSTDYNARSVQNDVLTTQLENDLQTLLNTLGGFLSTIVILAGITAIIFAQGVIAPVRAVTQAAKKMEEQGLSDAEINRLREQRGGGEVSHLARTFGNMVLTVREREAQITHLLSQSDEALGKRVKELSALEMLGQQLTSTLDLDRVTDYAVNAVLQQEGITGVQLEIYSRDYLNESPLVRQGGQLSSTTAPLTIPLQVGQKILGQLKLYYAEPLGDSERGFADQLADWISVAVNNGQLFHFTQEQQAQLEIRNREIAEANRLKSEFLATMSHELRTPLNAIIGFLGIVAMSGTLTERNAYLVNRVRINSKRLLELINDILDISRIEAGRLKLYPTEINIRELVEHIGNQIDILAKEKNLDIILTVAEEVPAILLMDQDALTKIITNLLSNGIKFTEQGTVKVHLQKEGEHLVIQVKDTGIGIPAHMYDVIFESFRQVDGSSTRQHGGSGLGLSIVRSLCEAMGGSVQVESVIGESSTFTVTLPLTVPVKE